MALILTQVQCHFFMSRAVLMSTNSVLSADGTWGKHQPKDWISLATKKAKAREIPGRPIS